MNNGSVAESRLDDMVTRILAAWYFVGQDESFPAVAVAPYSQQHPIVDARGDNAKLIREIGAASSILVKNVNNALPLKNPRYLGVYGYDARVADSPWQNPSRFGGGYEVNFGWETFVSSTPAALISPVWTTSERQR